MPALDRADLLARFKLWAKFPTAGTAPLEDDEIDLFLSEGQQEAAAEIAQHCPWLMFGAPTLLTSADGGVTYDFPDDADGDPITPLAVEIYAQVGGRELYAASYGALGGDFVIEGQRIRMPGNHAFTFTAGPYARFVTVPLAISATTEPTLKPKEARPLIALYAARKFARLGGLLDESPFVLEAADLWEGKPNGRGVRSGGLRDALKLQYRTRMAPAINGGATVWWRAFVGA